MENYQLTLGGQSDQDARVGDRMGPGIAGDEVAPTVERIVHFYVSERKGNETFNDTYKRLGKEPYKAIIYGEENVVQTA